MARDRDRMPGGWKIASALLGFVVIVGLGWAGWLHSRIDKAESQVHLVQTQVTAENKERAEGQRKTDVSITEIKGEVQTIRKDVERIEKGQEKIQQQQDQIKEELRKNANQQERLNSNLEQILRQRGRTP